MTGLLQWGQYSVGIRYAPLCFHNWWASTNGQTRERLSQLARYSLLESHPPTDCRSRPSRDSIRESHAGSVSHPSVSPGAAHRGSAREDAVPAPSISSPRDWLMDVPTESLQS